MLYALVGTDPRALGAARRKLWKGALQDIEARTTSPQEFASLAETPSLFGEPSGFRLQNIFSTASEEGITADVLLGVAKELVASPHTFILEEEKLLTKPKGVLAKAGAEIIETAAPAKKEAFNVFALGDALAKKDRKRMWLLLMQALGEGVAPENIAGILAWKARSMLGVAKSTADKKEWTKLSRELVVMYHESHRGAGDLALLLERFALTL